MAIETILTCPLGSKCEEAKDGKIYRCAWYTKLQGKNPQSEEIIDEWGCAISWLPLMQVEVAQTNRGQTAAICSMRDESIKRQDIALNLAQQRTFNLIQQDN
jgi:hypothetical protein